MPSRKSLSLAAVFLVSCTSSAVFAAPAVRSDPPAASAQMASGTSSSSERADKGLSAAYLSCQKSAGRDILRSDACMSRELKLQDARLNRIYKALLGTLKPDAKKALVAAERTWLQSASRDEAFETALYGDSQAENAQQQENRLLRLCARADALDKYLAFSSL